VGDGPVGHRSCIHHRSLVRSIESPEVSVLIHVEDTGRIQVCRLDSTDVEYLMVKRKDGCTHCYEILEFERIANNDDLMALQHEVVALKQMLDAYRRIQHGSE